jgi:hypothetical protein
MLGVVICVRTSDDDEWLEDQRSTETPGCSVLLMGVSLPLVGAFIASLARSHPF